MRTLLGFSLWDMARAVGAEPTVIANLEAGAIAALPAWPELGRLIDAYAYLTGIDPQPIVSRLLRTGLPGQPQPSPQISAPAYNGAAAQHPAQNLAPPEYSAAEYSAAELRTNRPTTGVVSAGRSRATVARTEATPADVMEPTGRTARATLTRAVQSTGRGFVRGLTRGVTRWAITLILVVVVPALLAVTARLLPGVLYAALTPLPSVIAQPLRSGVDIIVTSLAPVRDGLTWVDVGDPRLRKAARLPGVSTKPGR